MMEQTLDGHMPYMDASASKSPSSNEMKMPSLHIDSTYTALAEAHPLLNGQEFRTLLSHAPFILFTLDNTGTFTLCEGQGLQLLGVKPGQLVGLSIFTVCQEFPRIEEYVRRALKGTPINTIVHMHKLVFELRLVPFLHSNSRQTDVIGVLTDISEQVKTENMLNRRERQFEIFVERSSDLIFALDTAGLYRFVNPAHEYILGYKADDLIGSSVFALIHPEDVTATLAAFAQVCQTQGAPLQLTCRLRHANGSWVTVDWMGSNCLSDPLIEGIIVTGRNVTERISIEETLRQQALHDSLTGLPNRLQLLEELQEAIYTCEKGGNSLALLMMDMNRFKDINDTFGHHYGDLLLQQVGSHLRRSLHKSALVARLGGDEFAILLPGADEEKARAIAESIHVAFEDPFTIADSPNHVEVSIGAVLYPEHGEDPLTLLRRADIAMYIAKQSHSGFALYQSERDKESKDRLALLSALREALAIDQLQLFYQPKADAATGAVRSVEALLRWIHPERGFIPPDKFIPLAEQTGLIVPLTLWVLEAALKQCQKWFRAGIELQIAVNLSMWDVRDSSLPDKITTLLKQYNVPAHLLRVELTESTVMTDIDQTLNVLKHLSSLGLHISVDDFGTGYSSLAYLKRLPVDELKIDRAFIMHMDTSEVDATIVRSTVSMAHHLGLKVVAEGVENQAIWDMLAECSCDKIQGYYLSKPIPAPALEKWLEERSTVSKK